MLLNKFKYLETEFIVQSYLKNEFVNICQVNGHNFRIEFDKKIITTSAKESKEWKSLAKKIIFEEVKTILDNIFYFKYCQSEIECNQKCKTQCEHCIKYYKPLI